MAFTETEVKQVEDAIAVDATHEDLFKLGLMYSTEVEDHGADYVAAHKWFSLAAMMGSLPAKIYREDMKALMSTEQLTLAQRAARGWMAEQRAARATALAA